MTEELTTPTTNEPAATAATDITAPEGASGTGAAPVQQQTTSAVDSSSDAGTIEYPAEFPEFFKEFGQKNKLTADQLKATTEFLNMGLEAAKNTDQKALAEAGQAHIQNWGQQAGEYMAVAKRALKQSDSEGKLTALLRETGFAHHPVVLEFFKDLGMNLREGGFLKGAVNVPTGERTLAQVMYGDSHPSKH